MSLFVDLKYLNLIGSQLPLFKKKKDNLYNCRCIICGDSSTKKNKTRGYFYAVKNELFYKCHNCGVSQHFGTFLKNLNQQLYSQYVLERYSEGLPQNKPHQKSEDLFKMEVRKLEKKNLLDELFVRLDKLPEDHEVIQFCEKRQIPENKYSSLYYLEHAKDVTKLNNYYIDQIKGEEPRLLIPFIDSEGNLTGATLRGLRNESLRYIMVKMNEDNNLVFGLDKVDKSKKIYVTEGPLDSLFLPNAIAVAGLTFGKLQMLDLPKENLVLILDNQPRNKEVCKLLDRIIDSNYNIVIWPQNLQEKDINDMILAKKNPLKAIEQNIYSGLQAKVKFTEWKRC